MRFAVPRALAAASKLAAAAFEFGRGSVELAPASIPSNVISAALAAVAINPIAAKIVPERKRDEYFTCLAPATWVSLGEGTRRADPRIIDFYYNLGDLVQRSAAYGVGISCTCRNLSVTRVPIWKSFYFNSLRNGMRVFRHLCGYEPSDV
jgi:hypothetical protein